ncbi:MAG: hypothetical protein JNJ69_08935 [Leptospiraceae bacterium]|nr:hypothetical protein [Leptospiraceae bacterium]
MKKLLLRTCLFFLIHCARLAAEQMEDGPEDGYLGIEAGIGYNTNPQSNYVRAPLYFTGGSGEREISTRLLLLSDIAHSNSYFSGDNSFLKGKGIYLYNFGLLDVDYLSWSGKLWAVGLGAGVAHQGFLIAGADKSAHAITGRLRAQGFFYWFDYFASQLVVTLPVAIYQSATDSFALVHSELNLLFDFKGKVRRPEAQSFMFSVSLYYDYININHPVRSYSFHDFTPVFKATVLY